MIKGQDWSGYQSASPSTSGLDFAFVKITEGLTYVNGSWLNQRNTAKAAGLVWGAYHYPHMANDPIAEADFFLSQVAWKPGDIIVLDWEGYDSANQGVPRTRQLAYRDAWLKYVKGKMPNHRVGMYCNVDYWVNVDKTSNCGDFLWIATGGRNAGDPGIDYNWLFHQYSTAGGLDRDVANFSSRVELANWSLGANTQEDDVALTAEDKTWIKGLFESIPQDVITRDGIIDNPNPATAGDNPYISLETSVRNIETVVRRLEDAVKVVSSQSSSNGTGLTEIKTALAGLDLDGLVARLGELRFKLDQA